MHKYAILIAKDLLLEARQKDLWLVMLGFSVLELFLFAFSLGSQGRDWGSTQAGILWMGFLFAGMLSLGRGYQREAYNETLAGIHMAPGGRLVVWLGKWTVSFLAMLLMESLVFPLYLTLFGFGWAHFSTAMVLVLLLGAVGVAAVGTFVAALAVGMPGHEAVMPVVLMPLLVPVAIAAVEATQHLWVGQSATLWIHVLGAYDLIFMAFPLLAYEFLWEV